MERIYVFLGALDRVNKACFYAFPTPAAAQRFADAASARHPGRAVVVQGPS